MGGLFDLGLLNTPPTYPCRSTLNYHCCLREGSDKTMVDIIKVSARSRSTAVAGAIAGVVREHQRAEVQAIKAAAIARGYLADDGFDVICIPYFTEVTIEDQERTALRLIVEPRVVDA